MSGPIVKPQREKKKTHKIDTNSKPDRRRIVFPFILHNSIGSDDPFNRCFATERLNNYTHHKTFLAPADIDPPKTEKTSKKKHTFKKISTAKKESETGKSAAPKIEKRFRNFDGRFKSDMTKLGPNFRGNIKGANSRSLQTFLSGVIERRTG